MFAGYVIQNESQLNTITDILLSTLLIIGTVGVACVCIAHFVVMIRSTIHYVRRKSRRTKLERGATESEISESRLSIFDLLRHGLATDDAVAEPPSPSSSRASMVPSASTPSRLPSLSMASPYFSSSLSRMSSFNGTASNTAMSGGSIKSKPRSQSSSRLAAAVDHLDPEE